MNDEVDEYDLELLRAVQVDARSSLEQLAHLCGLSVASVQRRMKRLRDSGMIQREVAVLDGAKLGLATTLVVMVQLERESSEELERFRRAVLAEPRVQQCFYVTGEADFCLVCVVRDMADFETLAASLFLVDPNVRKFTTSAVLGRPKSGLALPLGQSRRPR